MLSAATVQLRESQPGLLRLPSSIRLRIYDLVGSCFIDSTKARTFDLNGHSQSPQSTSLLLSCRAIYDELSSLLYSTNRFVIRYNERSSPGAAYAPQPLQRVKNLRPGTVRSLRHFKIILAEASCHYQKYKPGAWEYGECCIDPDDVHSQQIKWCARNHAHDHPLEAVDSMTRALLAEWDATALYLAPLLIEDTLDLAVVCDIGLGADKDQIAKSAVEPLLRLPKLKECSVRLCKEADPQLAQVAYEAVQQALRIKEPSSVLPILGAIDNIENKRDIKGQPPQTSDVAKVGSTQFDSGAGLTVETERFQRASHPDTPPPISVSSSRLIGLPKEIRLRILEYTDLISPWSEVTWSRQHKGFVASRTYCETLEFRGKECPPSRHHGCQFHQCWITYPLPSSGCFCRVLHSAYSTTSVCRCWAPPQALFLVCRQLYHDAQVVFFSGNRFVVHDFHSNPPYQHDVPVDSMGYFSSNLGISVFLKRIVPTNCLDYLRFLEIVFPPYWHDMWPSERHPALKGWVATLDWVRDKLNLPGLTIRLVMADSCDYEISPRKGMTTEQSEAILAGYKRILSPITRLRELGKFYAQFSWPEKMMDEWQGRVDIVKEREQALKEEAERLVMGDRYKGLDDRWKEPAKSLWQDRFYESDDEVF